MLFIPSGSAVFREELPHGMNGTKLQFGHYESSDGDASFADRGLGIDPSNPFPEKPLRLAEGYRRASSLSGAITARSVASNN